MNKMEPEVKKMEAWLESWGTKLEHLAEKADEAGATAGVEYRKGIDDLKEKHEAVKSQIAELRSAGAETWDNVKTRVESACSHLEKAFKSLTAS